MKPATRPRWTLSVRSPSAPTDSLLFDDQERGPDGDIKLEFEAISQLPDDEKQTAKEVLEALLRKHHAKRWAA